MYYSTFTASYKPADALWTAAEDALLTQYLAQNVLLVNSPSNASVSTRTNQPTITPLAHTNVEIENGGIAKHYLFHWRNISHLMRRQSIDCRHRYLWLYHNQNFSSVTDIWYDCEVRIDPFFDGLFDRLKLLPLLAINRQHILSIS